MKRRLWIAAMSLFILLAGAPQQAQAEAGNSCVAYSCVDNSGCDLLCACQYVGGTTVASKGRCGS
jgi:hypothetical protein